MKPDEVKLIESEEEIAGLKAAMAADGHTQYWNPSELIIRGQTSEVRGQIIGCASIGTIPFVNVWLDSQRVKARQTVRIISRLEEIALGRGFTLVAVPCAESSPLFGCMERFGYVRANNPTFLKVLSGPRHESRRRGTN